MTTAARRLVTCHCARWPGTPACTRTATQEDFLCDVCRGNCVGYRIDGVPVNGHIEMIWR